MKNTFKQTGRGDTTAARFIISAVSVIGAVGFTFALPRKDEIYIILTSGGSVAGIYQVQRLVRHETDIHPADTAHRAIFLFLRALAAPT